MCFDANGKYIGDPAREELERGHSGKRFSLVLEDGEGDEVAATSKTRPVRRRPATSTTRPVTRVTRPVTRPMTRPVTRPATRPVLKRPAASQTQPEEEEEGSPENKVAKKDNADSLSAQSDSSDSSSSSD